MKKIFLATFLLIFLAGVIGLEFAGSLFAVQEQAVDYLRQKVSPLRSSDDLSSLIEAGGRSRVVLLGEASHGTSEYYLWRKKISRRLIEEKDFSFIVVEGDWPSCFALNLYVKGKLEKDLEELLRQSFQRWPRWMWANQEIVKLAEWLKEYNSDLPAEQRVGFYGMDVYSLKESAQEVRRLIKKFDDEFLLGLKGNYRCFERFDYDGFDYARAVYREGRDCRSLTEEMVEAIKSRSTYLADKSSYDYFNLKMNAIAVKNAEKYYRLAVLGDHQGWNSRVYHMEGALYHLLDYYGEDSQGIVWAHNTHVGDARATSMRQKNQVNIGQLSREAFGEDNVFIVGFGTYQGEVVAGRAWGAPLQVMQVPAGKKGSLEHLLAQVDKDSFLIIFDSAARRKDFLSRAYGHRAIGVVYNPQVEHLGNYVPTAFTHRYDAFLFFQNTQALNPLGQE